MTTGDISFVAEVPPCHIGGIDHANDVVIFDTTDSIFIEGNEEIGRKTRRVDFHFVLESGMTDQSGEVIAAISGSGGGFTG